MPFPKSVAAYYIDEYKNHIWVELIELNDDEISKFKANVMDSSMIKFKKGEIVIAEASARPGRRITLRNANNVNNPESSLGFRVRRGGINGFIMTAHGNTGGRVGQILRVSNDSSSRMHIPNSTARVRNARVDAAYCRPIDNVTLSRRVHHQSDPNYQLATGTGGSTVGQVIWQAGNRTQITRGTIQARNVAVNVRCPVLGVMSHTHLMRGSYHSDGGDSGGAVYRLSTGSRGRVAVGIHVASNGHYCSASNIISALDVTPY